MFAALLVVTIPTTAMAEQNHGDEKSHNDKTISQQRD